MVKIELSESFRAQSQSSSTEVKQQQVATTSQHYQNTLDVLP